MQLLSTDKELLSSRQSVLLNNIEDLIAHPRFMMLVCGVVTSEYVPLLAVNPSLAAKVDLLKNPDAKKSESLNDPGFLFNARLSHLVKSVKNLNSISLTELQQKFCFGQNDFSEKETQKLVVKAIQFGLIHASIDKKSNKVYFQWVDQTIRNE